MHTLVLGHIWYLTDQNAVLNKSLKIVTKGKFYFLSMSFFRSTSAKYNPTRKTIICHGPIKIFNFYRDHPLMMSEFRGRKGVQEIRTLVIRVSTQNSDMGEGGGYRTSSMDGPYHVVGIFIINTWLYVAKLCSGLWSEWLWIIQFWNVIFGKWIKRFSHYKSNFQLSSLKVLKVSY